MASKHGKSARLNEVEKRSGKLYSMKLRHTHTHVYTQYKLKI